MEWKRIKSMLIVLFLIVDIFLIYQLYKENNVVSADAINAIISMLEARNIEIKIDEEDIIYHSKLPKVLITSEEGISEDIKIRLKDVSKEVEYIGNKREIIDLVTLLATFIRDNKAENLVIDDIYLCYYYNSMQVGENVKYAEAEPSWIIEVGDTEYIYSAYTGNFSKKLTK